MENKQPLITLCMIVKNEEKIIKRCLESVKNIVDEYCILDTGSTDNTVQIIEDFTATTVYRTEFRNFVDTKNEVLEKANGKYILWMDADEIMGNPCFLRLASYAEKGVNSVVLNKMQGDITYYKYRLWPNNPKYRFKGPYTHEYLSYDCGTIFDDKIKVTEIPNENKDWSFKFKRDIDLIRKYLNEVNEKDPRALFYLAQSYASIGDPTSINIYLKYLDVANFDDEIFWSYYQIANIYSELSEYQNAIKYLNIAEVKFQNRAEIYSLRGNINFLIQNWQEAINDFEKIKSLKIPNIIGFVNTKDYNFENFKEKLSICYYKTGDYINATKYNKSIINRNSDLDLNYTIFNNRKNKKIGLYMGPFPKKIYGGILYNEGLYGTETAYIELSEIFAKLGMDVYLFTQTDVDFVFKNVKYVNYNKFDEFINKIDFDIIINSRHNIFNQNQNFIKVLWLHDLYLDDNIPYYNFDILVCSTEWHKQFLLSKFGTLLDKNKIYVIPLSLNDFYYKNLDLNKKDPYKIVYSSSLDRGILNYLPYFDDLLSKNNKFKLYLYYGLDISKLFNYQFNLDIENQLNYFLKQYPNNLINKGRVNKIQLANEKLEATYSIYTINFLETFGITLLENQISAIITLTAKRGAIVNTLNSDGNIFIEGSVDNDIVLKDYNEKLLYLHNNPIILKEKQKNNIDYIKNNFKTWQQVGEQWLKNLYNLKYTD